MASEGYPEKYEKGFEITMTEAVRPHVFVAGAALRDGKPVTSGSDCHHRNHACKGGIMTDRPIRTPRDLTDVLRSGDYTLYRGK